MYNTVGYMMIILYVAFQTLQSSLTPLKGHQISPHFSQQNSPGLRIIFEVYNGLHHVGDSQNGAVARRTVSWVKGSSKPNSEPMVNRR